MQPKEIEKLREGVVESKVSEYPRVYGKNMERKIKIC